MTTRKGVTVTVNRAAVTGTDRYNDDTVTRTPHDIKRCVLGLSTTSPLTDDGRTGSILGATLYCPPGANVQHSPIPDLITVDGLEYVTDGEPFPWTNGYTDIPRGVQVPLKVVQG